MVETASDGTYSLVPHRASDALMTLYGVAMIDFGGRYKR